jgi:AhpD family alkylhydroperoxidase
MNHPAFVVPGAMDALQAVGKAVGNGSVSDRTIELVCLRASQINGCAVCLDGHARTAKEAGETDERLFTLAAWRESSYFTDAERAALALTEAVTRVSDRPDPVSDEIYDEAAKHYDEAALATLLLAIANINVWNRLNAATRQIAEGKKW